MYKVIGTESTARLEEEVNEHLLDGWTLAGGVQACTGGNVLYFYQALWKKAKVQKQVASAEYSVQFLGAWMTYPKRAGSNSKKDAWHSWMARCRDAGRDGVDECKQAMIDGVVRYAKFCEQTGKTNTEFVMQAATFFGPSQHYLEDWAKPEPVKEQGVPRENEELEKWAASRGMRGPLTGESWAEYRRYLQNKLKEANQ
jgi:hypothetical protein